MLLHVCRGCQSHPRHLHVLMAFCVLVILFVWITCLQASVALESPPASGLGGAAFVVILVVDGWLTVEVCVKIQHVVIWSSMERNHVDAQHIGSVSDGKVGVCGDLNVELYFGGSLIEGHGVLPALRKVFFYEVKPA